ncbi:hypothetical protein RDI58_010694 [Solanum bulbocastanum]|uniref:DUF4219 domain-containing protein n=1 Tax=Solanum bulbocastanum TaxID=147425 RepID=A0AAN8TNE3_SOLBU
MEESSSFSTMTHHVFNGDNFHTWAMQMKTYLKILDLWEAIKKTVKFFHYPYAQKWLNSKITRTRKPENLRQRRAFFK